MADSTVNYVIGPIAYVKIVAHAAKYPSAHANGVLLGKREGNRVSVVDATPLLHHWTSLSPVMEIGLDLVCVIY